MFEFSRIQNSVASLVAAFLLASVTVGAAVGPAHAVEAAPVQVSANV